MKFKCMRGGSRDNGPDFCRSANRGSYDPVYIIDDVGFRVVIKEKKESP